MKTPAACRGYARQVEHPRGGRYATEEHPRWNKNNTHFGTDEFGFSALPGVNTYSSGTFDYIGNFGFWWSSAEFSEIYAWSRYAGSSYGYLDRTNGRNKTEGLSVRCVRD